MKIAAITDDGTKLSAHFGRARHFLVLTAQDGEIVARELRDKVGHQDFAHEGHSHGHSHEHEHDAGEHHAHHGRNDPRGHGFGRGSGQRHASMMAAIADCEVLLARGMGQGAALALEKAGIQPITTEIRTIDEAVQAYLSGEIADRPERRH